MKSKLLIAVLLTLSFSFINAGTIIYKVKSQKEPLTLSKVSIVSIEKNVVTIKHGDGIRSIPLSYLVSYYDTNIDVANFEDNTADYKINVRKLEMPESGYTYERNKKTKKKSKKTSECEIEFSVNKKYDKNTSKTIRMPYFYLYVLTSSSESYGKRPVYTYYYPKEAKVKSKTYDKAKVIEAVRALERPRIYNDGRDKFAKAIGKIDSGAHSFKISLKGIKNRQIIAYYLEVWGKEDIIYQKSWHDVKYNPGKDWWKRY